MYYSNDSQGTLSIIYVDFLIMAREREAVGIWISFPVLQSQISRACSYYFKARFLQVIPLIQSYANETHTANILNQSDSCNEAKTT